jgi:hypothetical protein
MLLARSFDLNAVGEMCDLTPTAFRSGDPVTLFLLTIELYLKGLTLPTHISTDADVMQKGASTEGRTKKGNGDR